MGTEDYGTTIIKDMSQQGIEVFSIIKGEPGENFGEVAIGGTMELNLAVNTTLGFKCMDPAVTYDIYITTAKPGEEPTKYEVYSLLTPVDELELPWKSVPNFDSVLHGYNILKMDPFAIDCTDGKKGMVYEDLASNGRDYDTADGNIYFKRGFSFGTMNTGWGTSQTQVHTSEESFQHTFTSCLSGGVENAGTLSSGYKTMTEDVKGSKSMYTTSQQHVYTYSVSVDMGEAKLTEQFVEAVQKLPYDASIDDDTTYDQLDPDMKTNLADFVEAYGTHMSLEMTFGGYYLFVNSMTEDDMKTTTQKGINIGASATVEAEGVPVTGSGDGGYEDLDSSSSSISATVSKYRYRGGEGGMDNWTGDDIDNSQAMKVSLQRLHEVLQPDYFPTNMVPTEELKTKKIALGLAITNYIGSPYDPSTAEMKPMIFKIEYKGMKLTNAKNDKHQVCGQLKMIPSDTLNNYQLPGNLADPYLLFDRNYPDYLDNVWNSDEISIQPDATLVNVMQFQPPFEAIGDKNMYVTLHANLAEADTADSNPEHYGTSDVQVKLGGTAQADYWVDLIFGTVTHEVSGQASKSKDGKIHAYFETSWVEA